MAVVVQSEQFILDQRLSITYNPVMETITTRGIDEIPANQREAIEQLLGQTLSPNQQLFIMTFSAGIHSDADAVSAARENLQRMFAAQADRAVEHGICADEADDAVDEAMRHIRHRSSS